MTQPTSSSSTSTKQLVEKSPPPLPYNSYRGSSNDSNQSNSNNNHRFIDYDLDHLPPPHVAPYYHNHHHNPPLHHFHQQLFYKEEVKEGTDIMEQINTTLKRELKHHHLYNTETKNTDLNAIGRIISKAQQSASFG
eukprot:15328354-Ditylum_brightwellii.AAC.1